MARLNDVQLQLLIDLVQELKTDLGNLRTDFRAHNHKTDVNSYGHIFLNAAANSFTGTAEVNTATSASAPAGLSDFYKS